MKILQKMQTAKRLARLYLGNYRKGWKTVNRVNPGEVVFLGYRTLSDGRIIYDHEEGNSFVADRRFRACLVVPLDGKRNPFYVLEEDLKEAKNLIKILEQEDEG